MEQAPALAQLMGAYFHQDWYDAGTEEDVVDNFLRDEPDLAPLVSGEIADALAEYGEDQALGDHLGSLGSAYNPARRYGGYRPWLLAIADQVQQRRA